MGPMAAHGYRAEGLQAPEAECLQVMELAEGGTLTDLTKSGGVLEVACPVLRVQNPSLTILVQNPSLTILDVLV